MSRLRVLMVWCVAISAILIVYRVYNRVSQTPEIKPPGRITGEELVIPDFDPDAPKIGGVTVGSAKESKFIFRDEETKEIKQVFGFKKLLRAKEKTKAWPLEGPYMNMYEDSFTCQITSDKGTAHMETVDSSPALTEAVLYENVVIHIHPVDPESGNESIIYMDHLNYNSERSEFSTDGPVRFVSEEAEMEGRGLVLIYNSGLNRIEFLKIVDLDYLRVKNVSDMSVSKKEADSQATSAQGEGAVAATVEKEKAEGVEAAAATDVLGEKVVAAAATDVPEEKVVAAETADEGQARTELYLCTLNEDVAIRYGDVVVVEGQDRISISNIVMSQGQGAKKEAVGTEPVGTGTGTGTTEAKVSEDSGGDARPDSLSNDAKAVDAGVLGGDGSSGEVKKTDAAANSVEVYVTCKGGIVVKPMTSVYENTEPQRVEAVLGRSIITARVEGSAGEKVAAVEGDEKAADAGAGASGFADEAVGIAWGQQKKPPDRFRARMVEYDMSTGSGMGHGPVEAMFYPDPNSVRDPNETVFPMTVVASKNAEFFANDEKVIDRVVFNNNVVGTRRTARPEYEEANSFKGEKLTVNIDQAEGVNKGNIRSISVTDGDVMLESVRNRGDVKTGHVRLVCVRIDYDGVKKIVYAVGPGNIQMNNENAPEPETGVEGGGLSFHRPCFGLVRGFDRLTWFTEAMQINADGKNESVFMAYWPIEKGKRGRITRGSTTHLQVNFVPLGDGSHELATMIAAGGIYYEEVGGNIFVGENLLYEADKSLLAITSSEKNACLLNGALVDKVEYEVDTGNVRSELASSPGAITVPGSSQNQR